MAPLRIEPPLAIRRPRALGSVEAITMSSHLPAEVHEGFRAALWVGVAAVALGSFVIWYLP